MNEPALSDWEIRAVREALRSGWWRMATEPADGLGQVPRSERSEPAEQ